MNEPSPAEQEVIRQFCEALGSALRRISGKGDLKIEATPQVRPLPAATEDQLVAPEQRE